MTEHRPDSVTHYLGNRHDYLPAAGNDLLLPAYDLLTRLLGIGGVHDRLVEQAELEPGHRVLEIGCGTGNLTLRAHAAGPGIEVVGSDPDPRALARAARKARGRDGIRFERGYAQQLPYRDGEFDRVLSAMMLHHLDPDVRVAMAAEVKRVLRPGGRLHLVDIGDDIHHPFLDAGFDCTATASHKHRIIGRLTYYRAVRPA
ncbi:class I SAM-dependent methyltransferase [Nocardia crassostreae]|uniref:class I SAM-dependent methyltransferase n=1 Tax=Nocardia crassostreae TaxID=53428 RepID=UPI00082F1FCA|nr:class I SAM-dependent methyltransferase [Nocardia crassostreae]